MTDSIILIDGVYKSFAELEEINGGFIDIDDAPRWYMPDGAILPANEANLQKCAPTVAANPPAMDLPKIVGLFFLAVSTASAISLRRLEKQLAYVEFRALP